MGMGVMRCGFFRVLRPKEDHANSLRKRQHHEMRSRTSLNFFGSFSEEERSLGMVPLEMTGPRPGASWLDGLLIQASSLFLNSGSIGNSNQQN